MLKSNAAVYDTLMMIDITVDDTNTIVISIIIIIN